MSTSPAEPPTEPPSPSVPYGPDAASTVGSEPAPLSGEMTAETVAKGVGRTALKYGIRAIVVLLVRAVFRAPFRR